VREKQMEMTADNLHVEFAHLETSSSDASLANYDGMFGDYLKIKNKVLKLLFVDILKVIDEKPFDDPYCNPKNPRRIKFSDISSAAFNIRDGIVVTPTTVSFQLPV
jgi:hypothetical protein